VSPKIKKALTVKQRKSIRNLLSDIDSQFEQDRRRIKYLEKERSFVQQETTEALREAKNAVLNLGRDLTESLTNLKEENKQNLKEMQEELFQFKKEQEAKDFIPTYAEKAGKPKSTIVIKPLDAERDSRDLLRKIADLECPEEVDIQNVKPTPLGVEVRCCSSEGALRLGPLLEEKLREVASVEPKRPRLRNVIFFDVPENTNRSQFEEQVAKLTKADSVMVLNQRSARRESHEHWVVRMNARPERELHQRGSLQLGFRRLNVRSFVVARRCYNCQALGDHMAAQCRHDTVCVRCGGNHVETDCPRKMTRCINCTEHNKRNTINGKIEKSTKRQTDHAANATDCSSWLSFLANLRRNSN
jgi:hypothetical protein